MIAKIWTVSRGPVAATQIDVEKAQVINALIEPPAAILPSLPGDLVKPFSKGLFDQFRQRLKPGIGATTLRRAIGAFVHSRRYYFASAQPDAMRHSIDGLPTEAVSAEDRLLAQLRFVELKRKHSRMQGQNAASPGALITNIGVDQSGSPHPLTID
ncbi:ProQ/FINO family protein [Rhizobium populisoli]|uniref:ProQ/FINO family protein n=1 Tax=Rhizobium populisoli TaxID=2859785 RepID=UPI001FEADD60